MYKIVIKRGWSQEVEVRAQKRENLINRNFEK